MLIDQERTEAYTEIQKSEYFENENELFRCNKKHFS